MTCSITKYIFHLIRPYSWIIQRVSTDLVLSWLELLRDVQYNMLVPYFRGTQIWLDLMFVPDTWLISYNIYIFLRSKKTMSFIKSFWVRCDPMPRTHGGLFHHVIVRPEITHPSKSILHVNTIHEKMKHVKALIMWKIKPYHLHADKFHVAKIY